MKGMKTLRLRFERPGVGDVSVMAGTGNNKDMEYLATVIALYFTTDPVSDYSSPKKYAFRAQLPADMCFSHEFSRSGGL